MSLLQNSNAISAGGYDVNNSLRFRSSASAYLSRTPASAGNLQKWTYSAWVKRGSIGTGSGLYQNLLDATGSGNVYHNIRFVDDKLTFTLDNTVGLNTNAVFRDPSAWYHVVVVWDTPNATAADRMIIYVNGVRQVVTITFGAYPTQNSNGQVNSTNAHAIGRYIFGNAQFFDGYITEVNFIDGQALTPSSFGSTNALTGVWQPAKYTGTYGTNGFYLPFKINSSTSSYAGSFNGSSQYLSSSTALFNYTTANASTQTATIEAMVYLNSYQTASQVYYSPAIAAKGDVYMNLGVNGSGNLIFYHYDGTARTITGSSVIPLNTWTYVAVTISGGTATIYVNGTSVGSGTWYGIQAAGQNSTSYFGRPATSGSALYLNGYISNLRVSSIARTISTPSTAYSNDANTNLLTLQSATVVDNSTNAYAITNTGTVTTSVAYPFYTTSVSADYSGNNNNWTANNINVASSGTTYDAMTDSPTNTSATVANYAVINPLQNFGIAVPLYSNANLTANRATTSSAYAVFGSSFTVPSTGYWYAEYYVSGTYNAPNNNSVGILNSTQSLPLSTYLGGVSGGYAYFDGNVTTGYFYNNGSSSQSVAGFGNGDTLMVAFGNGKVWFGKNGTWLGTGSPNPSTATSPAYSGLSGDFYFCGMTYNHPSTAYGYRFDANFGQRPFTYTPPSGYVALNTYNLPTPTILQGNKYMDATLYTGNGATQNIVNAAGFKPDLVWNKGRSNVVDNCLTDSNRGANKQLVSNTTGAELTYTNQVTGFNSNGFALGADNLGYSNYSAVTYVAWQWQAGQGSTSSNTSGSITSTVSVNTTAGFSIVTYTGTQVNATVGHGLGVAPKMVIVKRRSVSPSNWVVWHTAIPNTDYLLLNTTAAKGTLATVWNSTTPTSTTFSIGTDADVNSNSATIVAYCWAEIAGFSKFGSYTGNNSTDGPFVYCGFRPKFVLIKDASAVGNWVMEDTSRSTYNQTASALYPNLSNAEDTGNAIDILSNGFKVRASASAINQNASDTFIYMAFAESPFKNSLAR